MRRVGETDRTSVLHSFGDRAQRRLGRHLVVVSPHREQWHGDVAEQRAHVVPRERLAAQRVALVVGVLQGVQQSAGDDGVALDRAGGEPPLRRPDDERGRALRPHLRSARVPPVRVADLRSGRHDRRGRHEIRMPQHELETDGPAQ